MGPAWNTNAGHLGVLSAAVTVALGLTCGITLAAGL